MSPLPITSITKAYTLPLLTGVVNSVKDAVVNNTAGLRDEVRLAATDAIVMVTQTNGAWYAPARRTGQKFLWIGQTQPISADGWRDGDGWVPTGGVASNVNNTTPGGGTTTPTVNPSTASIRPFKISGGGYVLALDQATDGTMVAATDTAGAYRTAPGTVSWQQTLRPSLLTGSTYDDQYAGGNGSDGYAISADGSMEYVAAVNGVWSRSGGATNSWTKRVSGITVIPNVPDTRIIQPRLRVDPANANHAIYGSMKDGLWRTTDGVTWSTVTMPDAPVYASWPRWNSAGEYNGGGSWTSTDGNTAYGGYGISCVAFDRSSAVVSGRTSRVSVAIQGRGVYTSTDGGATWAKHGGHPWQGMTPTSLSYGPDGTLYVATPMQRFGLKVTATGGTYVINVNGSSTAALPYNATYQQVSDALAAIDPALSANNWAGSDYPIYIESRRKTGGIDGLTVNNAGLTGGVATATPITQNYYKAHRVWKVVGTTWTDITPSDWEAEIVLAADPRTNGRILAMQSQTFNNSKLMQISSNSGATWQSVSSTAAAGDTAWLTSLFQNAPGMWISVDAPIWDVSTPNRVWIPEGVGAWQVDISGTSAVWRPYVSGLENLVHVDVATNPSAVMVASWDRKLWRVTDQAAGPSTYLPDTSFGSCWSVSVAPSNSNVVAISLANHQNGNDVETSGYSTDGGATWTRFPTIPLGSTNANNTFGYGQVVAKSATDFLWVSANKKGVYYTTNAGQNWTSITLPGGADPAMANDRARYIYRRTATVDSAGTYYIYVVESGVYKSTDRGATWTLVLADTSMPAGDRWWNAHLKAVPNKSGFTGPSGNLWLSGGVIESTPGVPSRTNSFIRSTNGGSTWVKDSRMTSVSAFGFGPPMSGSTSATVLAHGFLDGDTSPCFAYTRDGGSSWTRVAAAGGDTLAQVIEIDGDWATPGVFYAATTGMGALRIDVAQ